MSIKKEVRKIIKEEFINNDGNLNSILIDYRRDGVLKQIDNLNSDQQWLFNSLISVIDEIKSVSINSDDYMNSDNWGLKSDGTFAVFDLGFGDYFEDFEVSPDKIMVDPNRNILDVIKTSLGIKESKLIGSGMFGYAHDIGGGKVLKITKDKSEAINAKKIIGRDMKHISNVFDVKKMTFRDIEYFIIILEKLKLDSRLYELEKGINETINKDRNKHIDPSVIEDIKVKNPIVSAFMSDMVNIGYKETWGKWIDKLSDTDIINKHDFNSISDITRWIKGSETNDNYLDEEPPEFVLDLIKSLTEGSSDDNLNEEIIEETFTGQKELEELANVILMSMSEELVKEVEVMGIDNIDSLYFMASTNTDKIDKSKLNLSELSKFMDEVFIEIVPVRSMYNKNASGSLIFNPVPGKIERFKIELKYTDENIDEIKKLFKDRTREITYRDIYFKIYYMFFSTLLHELQHAYDGWRSDGKSFNGQLKKDYIESQDNSRKLVGRKDLSPEEIKALNKSSKAYLNLTHEINARFAQAMHNLSIVGMDNDFNDVMKDWDGVYKDFTYTFEGWRYLSDKMKRKLTRRLSKAYQESSENLKTYEDYEEDSVISEVRVFIRNIIYKNI